jgi:hypothetical protein
LGLELAESARTGPDDAYGNPCRQRVSVPLERDRATYDIFEGTEQIQQLVISRAISGLRIE